MSNPPNPPEWVKSSYSGNGGGNCLEFAPSVAAITGQVPVRDSKLLEGSPVLSFGDSQWTAFVSFTKDQGI
ncbi:DUF397 domain-containing protein [Streptomyces antarcticus]|uniref:DUF397 domain-containing protein n=1 Tax=Streptomyces antarcticus TaxID=2996458 RepID=UPI0022705CAA|nr:MULTISPECIES: DUF397 domain-containing protein [unclassified Streptomyces]MCY0941937.1 DUF397 domain-containing protein [Streptomyces sp. H34-AA3]MCZ4082791.1 DUF397 domain-containing protein [Streptomyces sp. H34-S5]